MDKEYICVLDENGNKTGQILSRAEIHLNQLPHPVAHVWVINEKNELLVQKRSSGKKQYANVWHISAGGHVLFGEEPLEAAAREGGEELGISINPRDLIPLGKERVYQVVPETGLMDKEWVSIYLLRTKTTDMQFSLQKEEVEKSKWMPLDEFEKEIRNKADFRHYVGHPKNYYLDTLKKIYALN